MREQLLTHSTTFYTEPELWKVFGEYCEKNPKSKSRSVELTNFMRSTIASKGRKYGLRVPVKAA